MLLGDPSQQATAAAAMREVFLDLDDYLCRGNQPPQEWLSAWPNAGNPKLS